MAGPIRKQDATEIQADHDVRIEDYINDKLQTHADLEGLDMLLENVRVQQDLLKRQLDEANEFSRAAVENAHRYENDHVGHARSWEQRRNDIDRRMQIITQSTTSDDAVRKFEPILQKLDHLDMAAGAVDLLREIERLSAQARQNFKSSPRAALEPYLRMRQISIALKQAQPLAEDAAPHLVDWAEEQANTLWRQMKDSYASEFEQTLKKMQWPNKEVTMAGGLAEQWVDGVDRLLELQDPELKAAEETRTKNPSAAPLLTLLPLDVMTRSLELGFKYHFEGDKATNRPDKPEYFFSHISNLIDTYDEFFAVYLQPILARRFRDTVLSLNPVYVDSTSAWITALLPILQRKLATFLPRVSNQPQLLSHLIHELMAFDASLRDEWSYTGGSVAEDWRGLTHDVLVKEGWFPKWLEVEKNFALERYDAIIAPADSGEIDFDSVDPGITKPTKAAIRVNDLLETITDRYRNLSSLSQKLHFLIDIQISIFDKFHSRLHDSLEAYLTMTSSLARTMQGVSKEQQAELSGLTGLDRLCRLYGSSEYLEKKMRDWSEDVFFVELWDELQDRARSRTKDGPVGANGTMTLAHVASRTSRGVGGEDDDAGGLFDETCEAYRRLRVRTEGIIVESVSSSVRDALRPYGRTSAWSSLSPSENIVPSAELDSALDILRTHLAFLARVLSDTALRRIARQVATAVQSYVWDYVLMRQRFSATGAKQLQIDSMALQAVFDQQVAKGQGAASMRRLMEAVSLLNLQAGGATVAHGLRLQDVEERMFRDNEGAREVLAELGVQTLTETDARNVFGRRLDVGS